MPLFTGDLGHASIDLSKSDETQGCHTRVSRCPADLNQCSLRLFPRKLQCQHQTSYRRNYPWTAVGRSSVVHWRAGGLSRPIPWILTRRQIPPCGIFIIPSSRVFNLILSFSLLEDAALIAYGGGSGGLSAAVQPSNQPIFTGSLDLFVRRGMDLIIRRLLSLPGGIHFQKLTLTWRHVEDTLATTELVERCSSTLESLDVTCDLDGTPIRHLHPRPWLTSVFR